MFGLEKMFAHGAINKKTESTASTPEKSSVLDKAAQLATLLALLNMPLLGSAEGKTENNPDQKKPTLEETRVNLNHLISLVEKSNGNQTETLGGTHVKSQVFSSGEKVIVAEGNAYVMISQDGDSRLFFDDNADGVLDRLVINNEIDPKDGSDKKFLKNAMDAFTPVEKVIEENNITAGLKPEKITLFTLDQTNNKISIVDGETAGSLSKEGEEAIPYIKKVQDKYAALIESLASEAK